LAGVDSRARTNDEQQPEIGAQFQGLTNWYTKAEEEENIYDIRYHNQHFPSVAIFVIGIICS